MKLNKRWLLHKYPQVSLKGTKRKMGAIGILVICVSSSLCLYFLLALIRVLFKLCWTPIRMQFLMGSQGIKGPSYRSFHGSTKEILNMKKEAMSRTMDLSHDIVSKVQPHIHSWINKYGKKKIMHVSSWIRILCRFSFPNQVVLLTQFEVWLCQIYLFFSLWVMSIWKSVPLSTYYEYYEFILLLVSEEQYTV